MSEKEFLNSISNECVVVSIDKYESMVSNTTILTLVKQAVEKDDRQYGLSSETTRLLETLLNLKGADKK